MTIPAPSLDLVHSLTPAFILACTLGLYVLELVPRVLDPHLLPIAVVICGAVVLSDLWGAR